MPLEITIKNYRCFADTHPANLELRKGFIGLVLHFISTVTYFLGSFGCDPVEQGSEVATRKLPLKRLGN